MQMAAIDEENMLKGKFCVITFMIPEISNNGMGKSPC